MSVRNFSKVCLVMLASAGVLFGSAVNAFAGDTNEAPDKDTFELDPLLTLDNLHDGKPCFSSELYAAFGIMDGFSIGAGIGFGTEEGMAGGSVAFNINTLYTPVDTDHFDMDIMLNFDYDLSEGYYLTPSFEFNFDSDDDQSFIGGYAVVGLPIHGGINEEELEDQILSGEPDEDKLATSDVDLSIDLGMYFTVTDDVQLFIQGGFTVENLAENCGDREIVPNPLSIGVNAGITDNFELITELGFYVPAIDSGDKTAAYLSVGGVFGMFYK